MFPGTTNGKAQIYHQELPRPGVIGKINYVTQGKLDPGAVPWDRVEAARIEEKYHTIPK